MLLGLSLPVFTAVHVIISLVAIGTGIIVAVGMLSSLRLPTLTAVFLSTTLLTSLTGFLFPWKGITPGIILGVISVAILIPVISARYTFHMSGSWRGVYVLGSVAALFFNVLVLITQSFEKVPALHALAPNGNEPAFLVAQVLSLAVFAALGTLAFRRFHPAMVVTA